MSLTLRLTLLKSPWSRAPRRGRKRPHFFWLSRVTSLAFVAMSTSGIGRRAPPGASCKLSSDEPDGGKLPCGSSSTAPTIASLGTPRRGSEEKTSSVIARPVSGPAFVLYGVPFRHADPLLPLTASRPIQADPVTEEGPPVGPGSLEVMPGCAHDPQFPTKPSSPPLKGPQLSLSFLGSAFIYRGITVCVPSTNL